MDLRVNTAGATPAPAGSLDWEPPIERLRTEARAAKETGRPDPWSRVEAECWIDLIDAELSAQRAARERGLASPAIGVLRQWRAELQLIVRQLESVASRKDR